MFSTFTEWVDSLLKAAGHKYIKRVPYMSGGKMRYRYIYKVTHMASGKHVLDPEHMVQGAAFMLSSAKGSEVHAHITKVDGDMVTYRLDDGPRKGEMVTESKSKLAERLNAEHGVHEALAGAREKQAKVVADLKERGASEKQVAREQARLDRLSAATPAPAPKAKSEEPKSEEPKSEEPKSEEPRAERENTPTEYQLTARPAEIGDPAEWASRIQGAFRDSRGFVDSVIHTYTAGVDKINDLLRTTYATAPANKKQSIATHLERRLFESAKKTLESYTGVISWFVTGRDGVSAKERERRRAANERADRSRGTSVAPIQIERELQDSLGRFSPAGEKVLAVYNALVDLAEKMHTANTTMKDTSTPIDQRRARVLALFADNPKIQADVEKRVAGRGAVFDATYMHHVALEIQARRRKAREFGHSVALPEGFYENGIGNVAYGTR